MRSRGRCSGNGRRAGLRRSKLCTLMFLARRRQLRRCLGLGGILLQFGTAGIPIARGLRPRSEDWPNCWCRSLANRVLQLLDLQRARLRFVSAALARASAARSAWRWAMIDRMRGGKIGRERIRFVCHADDASIVALATRRSIPT